MLYCSRKNRGFTLVEFIVSISIVVVILTVVVSNQSKYTDGAALANLADEVGLSLSQAQAYGIGVSSLGSSEFVGTYGLAFSLLAGNGANDSYVFFVDKDNSKHYGNSWSCPEDSECLNKFNISRGDIIDSICVVKTSGQDDCNIGRVDISFTRPSTEAYMVFFNSGGQSYNPGPGMKGARVIFRSPGGATRSVIVFRTGQISVQ